ncbi:hypothetical protein QD460_32900, partial [Rhizobium jaguaris]
PDGFAVLGREGELSHYSRISVKPPSQAATALVKTERPTDALFAEGIPLIEARSYTSPDAKVVKENQALLYLTTD